MVWVVYYEQWADTADLQIFESAHHRRIGTADSNSNLEASQVPI